MTHWFALGIDTLRRKTEILEGYCAEIGRDPASIERTIGAPVIVAANPPTPVAPAARPPRAQPTANPRPAPVL